MTSNLKNFFSLSLLMICFFSGLRIKRRMDATNYQFNGRIDSVFYDIKNNPVIIVKGSRYYLSENDWDLKTNLQKGDLIFKKSKSTVIRLMKPQTGQIILIKQIASGF